MNVPAPEALQRLRDGNARFVTGDGAARPADHPQRRRELTGGQRPFAVVLGCSDSRVPAEIVFDQGLGDLFVIRVAGNIVAPSQIGSVEFAAEHFGTELVVVLGHTGCGAVRATLQQLREPGDHSPHVTAIVERIRPSVEPLLASDVEDDALLAAAVRANVRASAEQLRHASAAIDALAGDGRLTIVGAEYSLESGAVDFFDGVPS